MGCTSQRKIEAPILDGLSVPKGVLQVLIHNAVLLRDTSIVLKMNPYIVLKMGNQTLKSLVHMNQGTSPVFNEKFKFYVNSDKVSYGRTLSLSVFDQSIGKDGQIGLGTVDLDTILLNKLTNHEIKCHVSHGMHIAGWIKATLSYKQEFKGRLFLKPKQTIMKHNLGLGIMNCSIRLTVGQELVCSKNKTDLAHNPYHWQDTLSVNLLDSLKKGKLSIDSVDGKKRKQICYVDLDLQQLCNIQQTEYEMQLKHKQNHYGTIKFTTLFMVPEQYQHFKSFLNQNLVSNIQNSNISIVQSTIFNKSIIMNKSTLMNKSTIIKDSGFNQSEHKTSVLKSSAVVNQIQTEQNHQ